MSRTSVVATTIRRNERSQMDIYKLFCCQVALNGYNNINILLETDEGLYYSSVENNAELKEYMKKYYDRGFINTDGVQFKSYYKRTYEKYMRDKYPNRPAYIVYVGGRSFLEGRGQNVIFGINEEQLNDAKKSGKQVKNGLMEQLFNDDVSDDLKFAIWKKILGI